MQINRSRVIWPNGTNRARRFRHLQGVERRRRRLRLRSDERQAEHFPPTRSGKGASWFTAQRIRTTTANLAAVTSKYQPAGRRRLHSKDNDLTTRRRPRRDATARAGPCWRDAGKDTYHEKAARNTVNISRSGDFARRLCRWWHAVYRAAPHPDRVPRPGGAQDQRAPYDGAAPERTRCPKESGLRPVTVV